MWRTPFLAHVPFGDGPSDIRKYSSPWYHFEMTDILGIPNFDKRFAEDYAVAVKRLDVIDSIHKPKPRDWFLDVGCSNGAFVAAATDRGYVACGIDLSVTLIDWAKKNRKDLKSRLEVSSSPPFRGFSVVTCHDVLEHLIDPYAKVKQLRKCLLSGGLLVVEAPDPQDREALDLGIDGKHVKPREHTMLLSEINWVYLLMAAKFKVIEVRRPVSQKLAIYAVKGL